MALFITHPGKKLLFMGQEFAHFQEWSVHRQLDWHLFEFESHAQVNTYVRKIYLAHTKNEKALYELDHSPWVLNGLIRKTANKVYSVSLGLQRIKTNTSLLSLI